MLEWFHITMRITVLNQYIRGVRLHDDATGKSLLPDLERIKWLLWHGNQYGAGETIKFFLDDVDALQVEYPNLSKFTCAARESCCVHRLKRRNPDQLWRAISRRRTHFLVPDGIIGERPHQQPLLANDNAAEVVQAEAA